MRMKQLLIILFLSTLSFMSYSQFLTINCNILVNNKVKDSVKITIIDKQLHKTILYSDSIFTYRLKFNEEYSVLFESNGCHPQMIYFNNHVKDYYSNIICHFNVNLYNSDNSEILNLLIVYYDIQQKDFNYKLIEL